MFTSTDLHRLTDINSFFSLSSKDFEYCCKFLLEKAGYGKAFVTKKGPRGGDGGIDLDVYSFERELIACGQCKLWKRRHEGLMQPIRELYGSMKIRGASRGIFLVTAEATIAEKKTAELLNIEMIDGSALLRLVRKYAAPKESPVSERSDEVLVPGHALEKSKYSFSSLLLDIAVITVGLFVAAALQIVPFVLFGLFLIGVSRLLPKAGGQVGGLEYEYQYQSYRYHRPKKRYRHWGKYKRRHSAW